MKAALLNTCSIKNKSCILYDLIVDNSLEFLFLTETWLGEHDTAAISAFLPETHEFHHFPRIVGRGGGVGAVVSKCVDFVKSSPIIFDSFECLEVILTHNNVNYAFYVLYRPPNYCSYNFFEEFEQMLVMSEMKYENVVYLGDFNIWMNDSGSEAAKNMREIISVHNLLNSVREPTHKSGNILDMVISKNNSLLVSNFFIEPTNTISDHKLIFFSINLIPKFNESKLIKFRNLSGFSSVAFAGNLDEKFADFLNTDFCPHNSSNVRNCVICCTSFYRMETSDYFNEFAPLTEKLIRRANKCVKWYDSEVQDAKRRLRKAEKNLHKRNDDISRGEFVRLRQEKCRIVDNAKKNYFQNEIEKCGKDAKKLSKMVNNLLGKSEKSGKLPRCEDKKLLANNFKNFFVQKIEKINSSFSENIPSNMSHLPDFPLIGLNQLTPVDKSEIKTILLNLNKTNCTIDPYDLKKIALDEVLDSVSSVFTTIINAVFESGIFPQSEKSAIVRPLLKGNKDQDELGSYRPLYNTSILSKVIEKACLKRLNHYLENFEAIPKFQSAYRKHHSVETSICRIYNDLIISKAHGKCTMLILLDESAAFDTVQHDILLNDLHLLGITGPAHKFFASYLTERSFSVEIDGVSSDVGYMKTGVPQGTILAPILFSIYTAELYHVLKNYNIECHFFADDTQLMINIETKEKFSQDFEFIFNLISSWMSGRKLKLNSEKTECIMFGPRGADELGLSSFSCGEASFSVSDAVRDLGVYLDKDLTMETQINSVKRKSIGNLINIARVARYLNQPTRLNLVHSLVFSHLDFCNSIYVDLPNTKLRPLQRIINNSARLVTQMPIFSRSRITPVCIDLHFLPLKVRIKYKICLLTYKALKFRQPSYLVELLQQRTLTRTLRSEASGQLEEPVIALSNYSNRCFSYQAPRMYNSLPLDIRNADSIAIFKKHLKTFIFREAYDLDLRTVTPDYVL